MPRDHSRDKQGESYQEAIAHWQLELQTELKKASSLPTAMFDACDPMLEARLAEGTESLFRCLLEQEAPDDRTAPFERQLERVPGRELQALLRAAGAGDFDGVAAPSLDELRDEEFFAILAEVCGRGPGPFRRRAAELLRHYSGDGGGDLETMAAAIARRVASPADVAAIDPRALAATCSRIAATVLQGVRKDAP